MSPLCPFVHEHDNSLLYRPNDFIFGTHFNVNDNEIRVKFENEQNPSVVSPILDTLGHILCHNQRWDMYVFIREPKFSSSIGYKVGARFRLSYKYINVPCLVINVK